MGTLDFKHAYFRQHYNDPLFLRIGNEMVPTELSKQLFPLVSEALNKVEIINNFTIDFDQATSQQQFSLAMTDVSHLVLLPKISQYLKKHAPHIRLNIRPITSETSFNMPDSLKAQHTAFLSTGHVLYSDLGRVMASIIQDEHGWNDALCGPSRTEQIQKQFGTQTFQDARNEMYRSGRDSLLLEMSKFSLGQADLSATVNLFSKVRPDDAGNLSYIDVDNTHQTIELRFEMDCLVFLSAAPLRFLPKYRSWPELHFHGSHRSQ
jgi:hypothetical protein